MPLNAIELVKLRMLERDGMVGSDGRDWLRIALGVAITLLAILGIGSVGGRVTPVVITGMLGGAVTTMWTSHAGRKLVTERIRYLRSRA